MLKCSASTFSFSFAFDGGFLCFASPVSTKVCGSGTRLDAYDGHDDGSPSPPTPNAATATAMRKMAIEHNPEILRVEYREQEM